MGLRNWLLALEARRLARSGTYQETIEHSYWTASDYKKDAARLQALGYDVFSESDNDPHIKPLADSDPFPTTYDGPMRRIGPPRRRRASSYHVIYRLRSAGDPKR